MRTRHIMTLLCMLSLVVGSATVYAGTPEDNWPTWRGPNSTGAATKGDPPITWSETENIKWKVEMPDKGDGTPIIWGDKIFLQTAIATADDPRRRATAEETADREIFTKVPTVPYKFNVLCLDRNTGKVLWEETVTEAIPHEGHHPSSSLASYSPVTDGEHVWFSFGSRGLYCYDLDGNQKWSQPLCEILSFRGFGEGSSPAIAGDAVIVVADGEGDSKIFAFNKLTGEPLWTKDRDEASSWSTPLPVEVDGKIQVITSGSNMVRSYDLETGDIVWQCAGLLRGCVPSPVIGGGKVFCMTGFQRHSLLAIELGHTGDLTDSDAIVWSIDDNTPYVPSPLLYDGRLYFVKANNPSISCYDAETGEIIFEKQKLVGLKTIYGSPTAAAGRIYQSDRKGTTIVVKVGDEFEVLATNKLDDVFDASPVVVGDELYLKGDSYLYCIAKQ